MLVKLFKYRFNGLDIPKILIKDIDSYDKKPWLNENNKKSDYFNYSKFFYLKF